jgi:hypothetical protein
MRKPIHSGWGFFLSAVFLCPACAATSHRVPAHPYTAMFSPPRRVSIRGYSGDAMEPFLSRDGKYLFFNNLNDPHTNTNVYRAERIDDLTFQFKGEIGGVNTSSLEGVPSMDRHSRFYQKNAVKPPPFRAGNIRRIGEANRFSLALY